MQVHADEDSQQGNDSFVFPSMRPLATFDYGTDFDKSFEENQLVPPVKGFTAQPFTACKKKASFSKDLNKLLKFPVYPLYNLDVIVTILLGIEQHNVLKPRHGTIKGGR